MLRRVRQSMRIDGEYTSPVGSFAANAFGLFDTAGNVDGMGGGLLERELSGERRMNGSAWKSGNCDKHVLRGGSW